MQHTDVLIYGLHTEQSVLIVNIYCSLQEMWYTEKVVQLYI